MKKGLLIIFLLGFFSSVFATHNRAGEITYKKVPGQQRTYEVTITTYTKNSAPADRCELTVDWGDGNSQTLQRTNGPPSAPCPRIGEDLGNDIRKNVYVGTHTYAVFGTYVVSFEDPNRNDNVSNIDNSVNIPFYVQSTIIINPFIGENNSPDLLQPPIDIGCVNRIFLHNPTAFDIDGDRLTYKLVNSKAANGVDIPEIYDANFAPGVDLITIDTATGELKWDTPLLAGQYNMAIEISEWRLDTNTNDYVLIGKVTRDMQVDILNCNNDPPEIEEIDEICVTAGDTIRFPIAATDINNDNIIFTAEGGPFELTPQASFISTGSGPGFNNGFFNWQTSCEHVRNEPYFVNFKAVDNGNPNLVDFYSLSIRVIAPGPENPNATPNADSISLVWDASTCTGAIAYKIYRKPDSIGFVNDSCVPGVPESTGYELIHINDGGLLDTAYLDTTDLDRGVSYCYMIVACFPDGAESYASVETCAELVKNVPIITNVDVLSTDDTSGQIEIRWVRPLVIDTPQAPGPYSYEIFRASGINGGTFTSIGTTPTLTDTLFIDSLIDTRTTGYTYRVDVYNNTPNNVFLLGSSAIASSIFLTAVPSDNSNRLNFNYNVPWINDSLIIFREDPPTSGNYIVIDTTDNQETYVDSGLVNGTEYCYRVEGIGRYSGSGLPFPLLNTSQEICSTPADTTAPCAPDLDKDLICEESSLTLFWSGQNCSNDVQEYNIYYNVNPNLELELVATVTDTFFVPTNFSTIVGCYAITAVDSVGNESSFSSVHCISSCPDISLPNVFTPNGDGDHDNFLPININDLADLEIIIYNRWGTIVYESTDIDDFSQVGWDGKHKDNGRDCAEGVYFFVAIGNSVDAVNRETIKFEGFIHLFR